MNTQRCSTSPAVLFTLLFVGLKLTGDIDWSWAWVFAPFWITFIINVLAASDD